MPIYEHRCVNGHTHDVLEKYEDKVDRKCPECSCPTERQLSAPHGRVAKGPYDEYL